MSTPQHVALWIAVAGLAWMVVALVLVTVAVLRRRDRIYSAKYQEFEQQKKRVESKLREGT